MKQECVKQKLILTKVLPEKHPEGLLKLTRLQLFLTALPSYHDGSTLASEGYCGRFCEQFQQVYFQQVIRIRCLLGIRDHSTKSVTIEGRASNACRLKQLSRTTGYTHVKCQ